MSDREELHQRFGEPHFVETDPFRTVGCDEESWAFELPSGQRVLLEFPVSGKFVELYSDPPEADPVLELFGLTASDEDAYVAPEPFDRANPLPGR